jgi:hypothetical protein
MGRTARRSTASARRTVWTVEAVRDLGLTTNVETAGAILGIGRSKAYELARADQFPVPIIRVGRRYLVPVAPLLALLTNPWPPTKPHAA